MTTSTRTGDDRTADHLDRGERSLRRWAIGVGLASVLAFTWMITVGRWDLLQERAFSGVFDLQGRSLMHGHLWVPDGGLGFEGFVVDGRTYAYFGIFPSLLRMPLFAFTDRFDGRLSALSMIAAYLVAYVATVQLVLRTHRLVRPERGWSRGGQAVAVLSFATVALGSNLYALASAAWVYHEAILWGAAGVLASFAAIVAWLVEPRPRHLVVAAAWATVAWLSRGSVGLGPTVALGLLGLSVLLPNRMTRAVAPAPLQAGRGWRAALPLLAAGAVGAVAFAGVNVAKFGSPTDLPIGKQIQSINPLPQRAAVLEAYDGTMFSPSLVPAVLAQTLRPDLVRPSATWPFLRFATVSPPDVGSPVFDTVEPSWGLTITHPLALALGAVGLVAMFRRQRSRPRRDAADADAPPPEPGPGLAGLRPLVLGGALGAVPALTIAFISQRYVTDLLPPVFVASAAGIVALDRWFHRRATSPVANDRRVPLVVGAIGALAVIGILSTLALTWSYQRSAVPPDAEARAAWIRAETEVARVLGRPPSFERADSIHDRTAEAGVLLVVGDCAGLYVGQSDGVWSPLEVTGAAGMPHLRVEGRPPVGHPGVALLNVGDLSLQLVAVDATTVRVDLVSPEKVVTGTPFQPEPDAFELEVDLDGNLSDIQVHHDGRGVLFHPGAPPSDPYRIASGGDGVAVSEVQAATPTCDALTGA